MWSRQPLTFEQQVTSLRAPPVAKGPFQSMRENGRSSVEFGWVPQAQAFPPGLLAPGQAPPVLRGVIVFPQAFPTCGYAPEVSVLFPDPANIPAWELRHPRLVAVQGGYTYHGGELAGWKVQDDREHGNLGWVMCRVVADLDSHARVAPRAPQQQQQPAPSQQYQRQQQPQQQQPQQQQQQQKQQQQPAQPAVEPSLPRPAPQAPTQLPAVPPAFPQLEALDRGTLEALLAETPAGAAAREGFLLANVPALSELLDRERQAAQACQAMAARAQEEAGRVAAAGASLAAAGEAARAAHAAATEARAKLQGATVRPDALLERMRREEGAWKAEGEAVRAALATPAGWAAAGSSSGSAGGGGGGGGGALAHHSAYLALRTKVHTVRLVREHLARALGGAPS